MITIQSLSKLFSDCLQKKYYRDKLTVQDIDFISLMDDATTITYIANALNGVLEGNPQLNKFKLPTVFLKLIYIICSKVAAVSNIHGVSVPNVVEFILIVILDSGLIDLDELETIILREIVESSIYLLKTEVPILIKNRRKWFCLG